jgi:hypothetical protein|tara:strand:+ start:1196 stop:1354 length:159 start_codon:yes stop_codon:yes gene_type:complete
MKLLGLKSKVRFENNNATVVDITNRGILLLRDSGGTVEITLAEAEDLEVVEV